VFVLRNVAYQPFLGGETGDLESEVDDSLPEIPRSLLPTLFARLSKFDKEQVLRHKIVPVACLPHLTLYGAFGAAARCAAERRGQKVVANINPMDYRATIRGGLGHELLFNATDGLKQNKPALSAHRRFTVWQIIWIIAGITLSLTSAIFLPREYFYVAASFLSGLFFLSIISLRLFSVLESEPEYTSETVKLSDDQLPIYSVLVPVFRETAVLDQLIRALSRLNYPNSKLDIKIILEETDTKMHRAISQRYLPDHFEIIVVPPGKPQTKPRALNYALQFARGELVTIYDAEDIPEPMQLRKAAARFAAGGRNLACAQAELAFYNANENWLTRQFTIEYGTLFKTLLPCLDREQLPMLLGGTSNHFRISVLRKVGGWDPHNVTEDADLGIRLARQGYQVGMLNSITYEEANIELGNWMQQRARWLKGFLQTWLVHMRNPVKLIREIGWDGFWVMNAMTSGIVVSALCHPFMIAHALYVLSSGRLKEGFVSAPMMFLVALNFVVLVSGYGLAVFAGHRALRRKKIAGWWTALLTMPVYWILMTVAAWMALWQFIVRPFHWNKTRHGLSNFKKDPAAYSDSILHPWR
jgi:glycosyltransferase XagB